MLCHENQWNAQSLSQKFDVTIEFSYEIFPAPLFVSFWSGAVDVVGGYRNDVIPFNQGLGKITFGKLDTLIISERARPGGIPQWHTTVVFVIPLCGYWSAGSENA